MGVFGYQVACVEMGSEGPGMIKNNDNPVPTDFIGAALKQHFDDLANSPVPDKFLLLLAELEAKELERAAAPQPLTETSSATTDGQHEQ
jgi:hypothetical protein